MSTHQGKLLEPPVQEDPDCVLCSTPRASVLDEHEWQTWISEITSSTCVRCVLIVSALQQLAPQFLAEKNTDIEQAEYGHDVQHERTDEERSPFMLNIGHQSGTFWLSSFPSGQRVKFHMFQSEGKSVLVWHKRDCGTDFC